ncbi:hypothetical protein GCM10023350_52400 [Nocardioides endophyticus]|jgi:hypothetical protein|uniref:Uncharacterized protein n=1 Tax=Nocardioides endophyticus TaxID=1353775 RepID=A0ABP8ZLG4_9ACTN
MTALLTVLHTENPNVPNHWLIGGVTLAILMALLLALLAFGAGREHS